MQTDFTTSIYSFYTYIFLCATSFLDAQWKGKSLSGSDKDKRKEKR